MSAYTTLNITAADARKRLMVMLLEADDERLERLMDEEFRDTLQRFRIVSEYREEEADINYTADRF